MATKKTTKTATKKLTIKDLRNVKAGTASEVRGAVKEADKIPLIDTLPDDEAREQSERLSSIATTKSVAKSK